MFVVKKNDPHVFDLEFADDHPHDELDQQAVIMDHDHPAAGGLEFFFKIDFGTPMRRRYGWFRH